MTSEHTNPQGVRLETVLRTRALNGIANAISFARSPALTKGPAGQLDAAALGGQLNQQWPVAKSLACSLATQRVGERLATPSSVWLFSFSYSQPALGGRSFQHNKRNELCPVFWPALAGRRWPASAVSRVCLFVSLNVLQLESYLSPNYLSLARSHFLLSLLFVGVIQERQRR